MRTMTDTQQLLYAGSAQRYDELLAPNGTIRPHWDALIKHLSKGGAETARRTVELTRRLIIENGVTYNVYADPQGRDRPWQLDPLPLLIERHEWRELEAGLEERARRVHCLPSPLLR